MRVCLASSSYFWHHGQIIEKVTPLKESFLQVGYFVRRCTCFLKQKGTPIFHNSQKMYAKKQLAEEGRKTIFCNIVLANK